MNCPSCALGKQHRTDLPDWIVCDKCGEVTTADHNHILCRKCEGYRGKEGADARPN